MIPLIFTGGNLIVLYFGAKPHAPGIISRAWWPKTFFLIMLGSLIYWAVMRMTEITVKVVEEQRVTLGQKIGFEVIIHNETDTTIPEEMEEAMVQSRLDGSRRRIEYKVSNLSRFSLSITNSFSSGQSFANLGGVLSMSVCF
jgi:hypothetical protein